MSTVVLYGSRVCVQEHDGPGTGSGVRICLGGTLLRPEGQKFKKNSLKAKSGEAFWERSSEPRPPMHFGRIKSSENASLVAANVVLLW